jgi:hypothetical protein
MNKYQNLVHQFDFSNLSPENLNNNHIFFPYFTFYKPNKNGSCISPISNSIIPLLNDCLLVSCITNTFNKKYLNKKFKPIAIHISEYLK